MLHPKLDWVDWEFKQKESLEQTPADSWLLLTPSPCTDEKTVSYHTHRPVQRQGPGKKKKPAHRTLLLAEMLSKEFLSIAGVVVRARIPAGKWWKEDQTFKANICCRPDLRSAWATKEPVSKEQKSGRGIGKGRRPGCVYLISALSIWKIRTKGHPWPYNKLEDHLRSMKQLNKLKENY